MTLLDSKPSTTAVAPTGDSRLPSLTGMRWAAAFMVFLYHVRNFGYFGGKGGRLVEWAFGSGAVGVSFFFILSGFVLSWTARDRDTALAFWRRRLARIYPVHLVTAGLALCLGLTLIPDLLPTGPRETAANLLLVSAWHRPWWQALNPVSWSLTCEAFFYAVFPLLHAGLRRLGPRAVAVVAVAAVGAVLVLPWAALWHGSAGTFASHPLARVPEFVLGAALGRLVRTGAWRGPGLDISLGVTLVGYFLIGQVRSAYGTAAYGTAACTIVGLALLIPAAATADLKGLPSFWRQPWLVRLGEWSFAFYMIHVLVLLTGERLFLSHPHLGPAAGLAATAAALAISLLLAWALYRGVEDPARRLLLRSRRR